MTARDGGRVQYVDGWEARGVLLQYDPISKSMEDYSVFIGHSTEKDQAQKMLDEALASNDNYINGWIQECRMLD